MSKDTLRVTGLRVERRREGDTLGVWERRPRLSWRVETATRNWTQRAYELEVVDAATGDSIRRSGTVASDESQLVAWGGPELMSRQRCRWRVHVLGTDSADAWSEWSAFEIGLVDPDDWTAVFIVPDAIPPVDPSQPVAYLRHEWELAGPIVQARLHVTALGAYEVELNGQRVGDHVLAPGWTSFANRVRVETFDVTELVQAGPNAIGVTLADGWYGERYGFAEEGHRAYGDELAFLAQLEIVDEGGRVHRVVTDDTWRSARGPVAHSGIYAGETYDARLERTGWSEHGFDDTAWDGAHIYEGVRGALVGRVGPPVRRMQEVAPVAITTSPAGRTIVDFGQNLVGWLRIGVRGDAGTTVTLRHAEVLEDGELCTRLLRRAFATDRYTLRGDGHGETWEPRFTFHGFRYAEVSGWPGELRADDLRAVVVHSDIERTGWFECSDARINQLHENIVWGMRGNFVDLPTDCPQRAERLGWTGDINVFAPTAAFLHDVDGFLVSWLAELAADQSPNGDVPFVIPDPLRFGTSAAVWSDAAVVVPWVLYERYGDVGVLDAQYASMRAWVERVIKGAGRSRLWDRGFQFGDWVDPAAPPDRPADARTDATLVAQAAFCYSLDLLARTAARLGNEKDTQRYERIGAQARRAFAKEFVTPNGRLASDAQTAYALAIRYRLVPDKALEHAGNRLAFLVFKEGFRIGTGFVGTPLLCDALCDTGHADAAYMLLEQTECPSWLYPVLAGATTIWERWDALRPDGTINPGEMNSFNHYALGAVGDWLHRTVAGIAPGAPGYRAIDVHIAPGGSLQSATARHLTPYGIASVAWRIDDDVLRVDVIVPPNTTATVHLPSQEPQSIGSGSHSWTEKWSSTETS
jgi:alpha-L-rhamnosidase